MQRQAMTITPKELIELALSLCKEYPDINQKFVVPIINKHNTSDNWQFEKSKSKRKLK